MAKDREDRDEVAENIVTIKAYYLLEPYTPPVSSSLIDEMPGPHRDPHSGGHIHYLSEQQKQMWEELGGKLEEIPDETSNRARAQRSAELRAAAMAKRPGSATMAGVPGETPEETAKRGIKERKERGEREEKMRKKREDEVRAREEAANETAAAAAGMAAAAAAKGKTAERTTHR